MMLFSSDISRRGEHEWYKWRRDQGGDKAPISSPASPTSPPAQQKEKPSFSFEPSARKKSAESSKPVQRPEDDASRKAANVEPIKRRAKSKRKRTIEKSAEAEEKLTQVNE